MPWTTPETGAAVRVTVGSSHYVARVYRPYVSRARLEAIQRVRQELARGGVPSTEAIPTRDGEPFIHLPAGDFSRLVEVEGFIARDANMDSWERLEAGLPWLGRWLALLDDEECARRGLAGMAGDVEWALQIAPAPSRWQAVFR